jgi:hypothetical protein
VGEHDNGENRGRTYEDGEAGIIWVSIDYHSL